MFIINGQPKQDTSPKPTEHLLSHKNNDIENQDELPKLIRISNDFLTFEQSAIVPSTDAATAANYPVFYVANQPCFLIEARLRHDVNGGSDASVDIEKLTNGTAKGSGTSMIAAVFDISAGARTTQIRSATVVAIRSINLSPGDAVALKATGTLTGATQVVVTVLFGVNMKNIPTSQTA